MIRQWDKAAHLFCDYQETSEYAKLNKEIVMKRFSSLQNKKVLDLGCGYGWYSNYFSKIGAKVIGCDGSIEMLKLARKKYPNIQFEYMDIEDRLNIQDNSFDIVFSNQVLMDIKNIPHLIKEVHRILKKHGIFYVSIVHPAFYDGEWLSDEKGFKKSKIIEKYLSEYSFDNEFWGKTRHYHRTISFYLNTISDAHFRLICLQEPPVYDNVNKSQEIPLFLFMEFEKL